MITNKAVHLLYLIVGFVFIPVQRVSTFLLGLLVSLTFGLLLLPISAIWIVLFLGPLLGLSWVFERVPFSRPIASVIGVPLAVLGNLYVQLMPSMGELDSRYQKFVICQTFPYTWRYTQLLRGKIKYVKREDVLSRVLRQVATTPPLDRYLDELRADVISRPENQKHELDW
ncbi:MAG: hypothetical protein ABIR70_07220 [Bryobacteraceae bacterium]